MSALAATAAQFTQPKSRFSPFELLDIMAAAIRASAAVESHRQPAPADLLTLGITGELPKAL